MKKTLFAVLAFFMMVFTFAENDNFASVCENLAKRPNMTGDFTQTKTITKVNRALKSSGTFIFSLDGIMWKTLKPFPSTLAVGISSVIQTKADGTKTVMDASSNQIFTSISSTLSAMFSGNVKTIADNFDINFSEKNATWLVVLTPQDATVKKVLSSLQFSGEKTQNAANLSSIVMTESSGDKITYAFSNQKYPKELSADEKSYFIAE